ncbi:MAG: hypothetical protein ACKO23_17010 [Gemmataceae bacterium]
MIPKKWIVLAQDEMQTDRLFSWHPEENGNPNMDHKRSQNRVVALMGGLVFLLFGSDKGKIEAVAPPPVEIGRMGFANVADLMAEIDVLNVLAVLQPTEAQMQAMRKVAPKTMQPTPPKKLVKVSDELRKTIAALRDAMAQGEEEKIEKLYPKYDEMREKENPEVDEVEITDAAREQAPALFRMLSARQVVGYVGAIAEFPDPMEQLMATIDESRKVRGKEWQILRDATAFQAAWLIAGLDAKIEEENREKALALLNKAARLSDTEFAAQRGRLETEARALVGKVGSTDVIRNYIERLLAELLSNHRLEAVLGAPSPTP